MISKIMQNDVAVYLILFCSLDQVGMHMFIFAMVST